MGFKGPFDDPEFLREVWILFGIGTFIIAIRYAVRIRTVGFKNFAGDDYMMIAVWVGYIGDAVGVSISYLYGTNLDWTEEQILSFTPHERKLVELGSRMQLTAWFTYSILIWGLKGCMLFFFRRLTIGLEQARFIKWIAVACAATWLANVLTYSCQCFPIQRNWQLVPMPPQNCTHKTINVYVSTITNVLTDALILIVPLPLIWKLRVSLKRKFALLVMLSSGVFVIAAAIIRIVFVLQEASVLNINRWGVRETIAGIIAVNVPIIRPIFMRSFWRRGPFQLSEVTSHGYLQQTVSDNRASKPAAGDIQYQSSEIEIVDNLGRVYRKKGRKEPNISVMDTDSEDCDSAPDVSSQNSQEQIMRMAEGSPSERSTYLDLETGETEPWGRNGIIIETSYDVVRPDTAVPQELPAVTEENVIYRGPDQQASVHGNRIDIYSDISRNGGTFLS